MKVFGRSAPLAMTCILAASAWQAAWSEETTRNFEIYGFAMADWIQDTKRVDPSWQDAFRPSRIAASDHGVREVRDPKRA